MELINLTINKSIDYGMKMFNPRTMPVRGNVVEQLQKAHVEGRIASLKSVLDWAEKSTTENTVDDLIALMHLEIMALNNSKVEEFKAGNTITSVEHWTNRYTGDASVLMH